MLRANVRPFLLACASQVYLLPKGLPEVIKRWQSNSSDSSTMQLIGPAPSQPPMPGEKRREYFVRNLESFNRGQYPGMSVKKFARLANATGLQKLLAEALEKQEVVYAEVGEVHTKVQSIETFLTKKSKLGKGDQTNRN